jgi:hypothetical protein
MTIFSRINPPPGYYVYAYVRKSNNTPYYIGKGKNKRAWQKHIRISTPNDITKIIILESNLTELGAFALERKMIRWYGRKNDNDRLKQEYQPGILLNKTDGGEGTSGVSRPGKLNGMYGKTHTDKVKKAQSIKQSAISKNSRWYNNGIKSIFVIKPPDNTWVLGRINQKPSTTGYKWYNNGIVNLSTNIPPTGIEWLPGMLPKNLSNNIKYYMQTEEGKERLKNRVKEQMKAGTYVSQTQWICEYCNRSGKGLSNYTRWHGDNCKGIRPWHLKCQSS